MANEVTTGCPSARPAAGRGTRQHPPEAGDGRLRAGRATSIDSPGAPDRVDYSESDGGMPVRMENIRGRSTILLSLALLLASCAQPAHKVTLDDAFVKGGAGRTAWRKVAVLPFAGDPAFGRIAGEWFAFRLEKHGLFEVVDASRAEIDLKKDGVRFGEAGTTVEEARKAGRLLGVDGVVFGAVDPRPPARPGWATAGASIVDMATGRVVAESVRSYPPWTRDAEATAMAAVDGVVEDLVPVFYGAAGRTWTPPPKVPEGEWPASESREPALR